jgi:hypothetical protein
MMMAMAMMEQTMIGSINQPPALTSSSTAEIPLIDSEGRIILDFQGFKKGFIRQVRAL